MLPQPDDSINNVHQQFLMHPLQEWHLTESIINFTTTQHAVYSQYSRLCNDANIKVVFLYLCVCVCVCVCIYTHTHKYI